MGAVFKRELKNYFTTSLGYIFIGLYLLFASVSFVMSIFLPNMLQGQTVYYANLLDFLAWVGIFLIPILTMRLWQEEKSQKIYQINLMLNMAQMLKNCYENCLN